MEAQTCLQILQENASAKDTELVDKIMATLKERESLCVCYIKVALACMKAAKSLNAGRPIMNRDLIISCLEQSIHMPEIESDEEPTE